MSGFRVQRYDYSRSRRRGGFPLGCGCGALLAIVMVTGCGVLYATGTLSTLVLQLFGAERVGDTDSLFAAESPEPVPVITEVSVPNIAVVDLGELGRETINLDSTNQQVVLGNSDDGLAAARATFTESGLLALCRQRSTVCEASGADGYRNVRFDLRPGGGVVFLDVQVGPIWQRVGLVMQVARDGTMQIVGIDIDGTTYNPDALPVFLPGDVRMSVSQLVMDVEDAANDLLRGALLDMGGQVYRVREVYTSDTALTVVMR